MRKFKIEQIRRFTRGHVGGAFDIEASPERSDLLRQSIVADCDRRPFERFPRRRKNIAFRLVVEDKYQGLVGTEQLLKFLDLERLRTRQGGIVGKLFFQLR